MASDQGSGDDVKFLDLLGRIGAGVWDFIVGDDWLLALGVVVVLGGAWIVSPVVGSWLVVLIGVPLVLGLSLHRAVKSSQ